MIHRPLAALAAATLLAAGSTASAQTIASTDFESGLDGWNGNGGATLTQGANDNHYYRIPGVTEMFWFEYWNDTNPDWIGDYTQKGSLLEFSVDVQTNYITVVGNPVQDRALILEFRSFAFEHEFYPYASVMFELGRVSGFAQDWTTYSTVFDPSATDLPEGWRAYGNENEQGEWILPDGATFADMMANVDEILIHSAELGFFYPFTRFDLGIDNITLTNIPAPGSLALLTLGALTATRRRRTN